MTREDARRLASLHRINLAADFHTLRTEEVQAVLTAADHWRYRAPWIANGSRARYFHALLRRVAARKE